MLLMSNLAAILVSFVGTSITVYGIGNLEAAVVVILIALVLRCVVGEFSIGKELNLTFARSAFEEICMMTIFVICNWCLGLSGFVIYAVFTGIYILIKKKVLLNLI